MTFVIGISCTNGLVLCTDSMESDGYTKKPIEKIRVLGTTEWQVAIAGSGPGGLVDKFCDEASANTPRIPFDLKTIESAIEGVLWDFRKRYPEEQGQYQMVVAVNSRDVRKLYRTEGGRLSPQRDFAIVGTGHELWRFLTAMLFEPGNSISDNVRLAVFAARQAIEYLDGVDEPIQLATCEFGEAFWKFMPQEEIDGIEAELKYSDFRNAVKKYWRLHNPPSHRDQCRRYKVIKTPGDELTLLDGVKLEELYTVAGRRRASKIFRRNTDRLQQRALLEGKRYREAHPSASRSADGKNRT